jgi:hypothetical protein
MNTDLQVKPLAAVLQVDPTCVSRCIAIVERRLEQDKELRAGFAELKISYIMPDPMGGSWLRIAKI